MKKLFFFSLVAALILSSVTTTALASEHLQGKVVKLEGDSALYYISVDGNRYVFPNEKAYKTWFTDFSNVLTVGMEELNEYPLVGNIRFRPGVLLVKIQSDPKVYAVAKNGTLRWIKTESIAQNLYGANWNQFVDDISAAFFVNYTLGAPIDSSSDFNPDSEIDESDSIDRNRGKAFGLLSKARKADTKRCRGNYTKRICHINDNLEDDDQDEEENEETEGTTTICHFPPGNPDNYQTLVVGTPAVRAHLAHGDTFGACEGDDDNNDDQDEEDETAPVISQITITPSPATSTATTTISWITNELSTSKVTYATSTTATSTNLFMVSDSNLAISHSLKLNDLTATTTYYFFVESKDESNNVATSTEQIFSVE